MSLETKIREAFERHANDAQARSDVWPGVERRIRRSHRIRVAGSGLAAAAVIAAIAVAVPRLTTQRTLPPIDQPTSAPTDVPVLAAKIPVNAISLAAGEGSLWALQSAGEPDFPGTLKRIDPSTNRTIGTMHVGINPMVVATGEGSVWVLNGDVCRGPECPADQREPEAGQALTLWRIDPRSMKVTDTIPLGGSDFVVDSGFGWATAYGGLSRVDLDPNVVEPVQPWGSIAGGGGARLAIGGGFAWVATEHAELEGNGYLNIVDLARRELSEVRDISSASTVPDVTFGFGSAWVTTGTESSASGLARYDATSRQIVATITLPDAAPVGLTSVTTGYGYVWATSARGYLWKVDPNTNTAPIDPILIGDAPPAYANAVVTGFGSVWVSGEGQIWRFQP